MLPAGRRLLNDLIQNVHRVETVHGTLHQKIDTLQASLNQGGWRRQVAPVLPSHASTTS